jgi:hypothetical protein
MNDPAAVLFGLMLLSFPIVYVCAMLGANLLEKLD